MNEGNIANGSVRLGKYFIGYSYSLEDGVD